MKRKRFWFVRIDGHSSVKVYPSLRSALAGIVRTARGNPRIRTWDGSPGPACELRSGKWIDGSAPTVVEPYVGILIGAEVEKAWQHATRVSKAIMARHARSARAFKKSESTLHRKRERARGMPEPRPRTCGMWSEGAIMNDDDRYVGPSSSCSDEGVLVGGREWQLRELGREYVGFESYDRAADGSWLGTSD